MTAQQVARILLAIDSPEQNGEPESQVEVRMKDLEQKIQGVIPPLKAITDLAAELERIQSRIESIESSCLSELKKFETGLKKFENGILWTQNEIKDLKQKKGPKDPEIARLQATIDEFKQRTDNYKMKIDHQVGALAENTDKIAARLKDHLSPDLLKLAEQVRKLEDTRKLCDTRSTDTSRQLNIMAQKIIDLENREAQRRHKTMPNPTPQTKSRRKP